MPKEKEAELSITKTLCAKKIKMVLDLPDEVIENARSSGNAGAEKAVKNALEEFEASLRKGLVEKGLLDPIPPLN